MANPLQALFARPALRRRVIVGGVAFLALWLLFLDGHSVLKRVQYVNERSALLEEIRELREVNEALEARLDAGLSDELVETVAREQYGMRRAGETVYPVEEPGD
jgi:cell division protein FtsB